MKKILVLISLVFILTGCFSSTNNENNKSTAELKAELLGKKGNIGNSDKNPETSGGGAPEEVFSDQEAQELITTNYPGTEQKLQFDDFKIEDFPINQKNQITGKVLTDVEKITVYYHNTDTGKKGSHTLTKFKKGDKVFKYYPYKPWGNFNYGTNIYRFEAKEGDNISNSEITIIVEDPKKKEEEKNNEFKETISIDKLPTSEVYGTPQKLGNGNITYSDVKGIEIEAVPMLDVSTDDMDSVTNYLKTRFNDYFYWNGIKATSGTSGTSYFVVRKKPGENKYIYEKHYYNGEKLYGVIELDSGELTEEQLKDKGTTFKELNNTLKEKNASYDIVSVTDGLFKRLTK